MKIRIDSLDTLCSEYIRKRALSRVHGCERCGRYKESYKQLQCSHYHKRRKQSTRFDEDNCNGFCFGCHQYFEENRDEYTVWMKQQLGDKFDMLEGRMRQIGKPDREAIALYYKEQIKILEEV